MVYLSTVMQLFCVNIDQEKKMLFSCDYDKKLLMLLKVTTKNEVELACIEYISKFNTKQSFQVR